MRLKLLIIGVLSTFSWMASAGFDWGSDCSNGQGQFEQKIAESNTVIVGEIPSKKANVVVDLTSDEDVDIQLFDKATGKAIVAWKIGLLSGATADKIEYEGVEYEYSGYEGVDGHLGHEYIRINGVTNRTLIMKVFGYKAGNAVVEYAFDANNTCNEMGNGSFYQKMAVDSVMEIGTIPRGKVNVDIFLKSARDLDIQLFDGDEALIQWPDGKLNGAGAQTLEYEDMIIEWSGYEGTSGHYGNEYIKIRGRVSRELTMKAFAFQSGTANVTYEWGIGAGELCGTRGTGECLDGWFCKEGLLGDVAVDKPGQCHGEMWCESNLTAAKDCANAMHIAVPGKWTCQEFTCHWDTTTVCPNLVPPHPDACPAGWQTTRDERGCLKFVCPAKGCSDDSDCDMDGEFCKKDLGNCHGKGTCWLPPKLYCPPPDYSINYGELCTCDGKTIIDYCAPQTHTNIAYEGACKQNGAGEGEMCGGIAGIQCQDGLSCHMTESYPDAAGVCRDYSINQGGECKSDNDCEEGLLCSNFNIDEPIVGTEYAPAGFCEPHWMLDEFMNSEVVTIDAGSFAETTVNVQGLATVAMGAYITIEMDMGYNGASENDLTFEVIPGKTGYNTSFRTSIVDPSKIDRVNSFVTITNLPVNFPGDDAVNGPWFLRITNANVNGKSARLRSFGLKVSSRWD